MGPWQNNTSNYGTFVVHRGCEVEVWREDQKNSTCDRFDPRGYSIFDSQCSATVECSLRRKHDGTFGLKLRKADAGVVIADIDLHVSRAQGVREGDVVTHLFGQALSGSLATAARLCKTASSTLDFTVESENHDVEIEKSIRRRGARGEPYEVVRRVVRQGDSLETLAAQHGTTVEQIRSDNRAHFPIGEHRHIFPSQVLLLRVYTDGQGEAVTSGGVRDKNERRRRRSSGYGCRKRLLYRVEEGDTLERICIELGAKEEEVRRSNRHVFPLGEPGHLRTGQTLTVFVARPDDDDGISEAAAM